MSTYSFNALKFFDVCILFALAFILNGCGSAKDEPNEKRDKPDGSDATNGVIPAPIRKTSAPSGEVYGNVVAVESQYASYDRTLPWRIGKMKYMSASGLILQKGLILTSGYIASDTMAISVTRQGESKRYEAKVLEVAVDLDLALLTVHDETFWHQDDAEISVPKDYLASLGSDLIVVGFPIGADMTISKLYTRVSRIDADQLGWGRYSGMPRPVLEVHPSVSKEISVGPVFRQQDSELPVLCGFASANDAVIPARTISNFLTVRHQLKYWPGVPTIGAMFRAMESPALREYWNLTGAPVGIQLRSLEPTSPLLKQARPPIQKNDVLLKVDGQPVFANGMMEYRGSKDHAVSLPFAVHISEKQLGEKTRLTWWRYNGPGDRNTQFDVSIVFKPLKPLVPRIEDQDHINGERPSYFIIGGLVWTLFSEELLKQVSEGNTGIQIPDATVVQALHRWRKDSSEQVVVLLRALEHDCNRFYSMKTVKTLNLFNDNPVRNMTDFIKAVGSALRKQPKGDDAFLRFVFKPLENEDVAGGKGDPDIVLDQEVCKGGSTDGELLMKHSIMSPASPDLMKTYMENMPEKFIKELNRTAAAAAAMELNHPVEKQEVKEEEGSHKESRQPGDEADGDDAKLPGGNDANSAEPEGSSLIDLRSAVGVARSRGSGMNQIQQSTQLQRDRRSVEMDIILQQGGLRRERNQNTIQQDLESNVNKRDKTGFLERSVAGFEHAATDKTSDIGSESDIRGAVGRLADRVHSALGAEMGLPWNAPQEQVDAGRHLRKSLGFLPSIKASLRPQEADLLQDSDASRATPGSEFYRQGAGSTSKQDIFTASFARLGANHTILPWTNVVKIHLVYAERDFLLPWKKASESGARCSGIIQSTADRRVMTNSHCVDSASALYMSREDHPEKVEARVVELAHDVDLAWITTLNSDARSEAFWKSLKKGDALAHEVAMTEPLPELGAEVMVIGYPTGGNGITITKGIVSRIDGQLYPNGLLSKTRNAPERLPIVQVDAAINPGNSGGPVFDSDGKLLGLAFAGIRGSQSIGYVIPNALIQNFIKDVSSNSKKDGYGSWIAQPELGIVFRKVENEGLQKFLGLTKHLSGVQVRSVAPLSALNGVLQKGDVITKLDDRPVTGAGTINFMIHGRELTLPLDVLVSQKGKDVDTKFTFLRKGAKGKEEHTKAVKLAPVPPLVARFDDAPLARIGEAKRFAASPTYFMFFGLIWGVFSLPMFHQAYHFDRYVPYSVQKLALHNWREKDEEIVVLLGGLEHSCNMYYEKDIPRVLEYFNGQKVNNMSDLVKFTCEAAIADEKFYRYTFLPLSDEDMGPDPNDPSGDPDIVLKKEYCLKTDQELLQQYNIPGQVSEDLQDAFAPYQQTMVARARDRVKQMEKEMELKDAITAVKDKE